MALDDILTAIRVVAAGDAIIAPSVTRRLIGQFADQPRSGHKPRELTEITDREREVLKLVGLGMSNAEIAAVLQHHRRHRQGPRGPAAGQAGRQRPGPARHHRLRGRPGNGTAQVGSSRHLVVALGAYAGGQTTTMRGPGDSGPHDLRS